MRSAFLLLLLAGMAPAQQDFIQLADQIKLALEAGNLEEAQEYAMQLSVGIGRELAQARPAPQQVLQDLERAARGQSEASRFSLLSRMAKVALEAGEPAKARTYANELLGLAPRYKGRPSYGNAIHYGNLVLGRLALRRGDTKAATSFLLASGSTPGSPNLNSFGPNMTLAQELLEKGVRAPVLEYFALCKQFWKMDRGRLSQWSAMVRGGGMPEFGANLLY